MRSVTGPAVFVAVLCSAAPAWAQQTPPPGQGPSVIVTRGEASLKRAPDQAFVSIAAEARAASPADAQRNAADSMKAVQAAISKAGIGSDAVRTTGYSLQPDMEYSNGRARVRGYIVRNQLEVRVDDLQKLAGVIDAAGQSGATSMAGLRFDIKDRATIEREALRLAVQDAMARARAIASGANAQIGIIIRIDEQGGYEPPSIQPMAAMRMEAKAVDTPVSPGELEVRAQVMLTVAIR
jgi:uncharacterized protein YggE